MDKANHNTKAGDEKKFLLLFISILVAELVVGLNSFIGMVFISNIGRPELAAGAVISTVTSLIVMFLWCILLSVNILLVELKCDQRLKQKRLILQACWIISIVIGAFITFLCLHLETILIYCGLSREITLLCMQYFNAYAWGIIPFCIYTGNIQYVLSGNKNGQYFIWSCISIVIELLLGYGWTFGHFNFAKLGIAGMGYASACSYIFICAYSTIHILKNTRELLSISISNIRNDIFDYVKKIIGLGFPIAIQYASTLICLFIVTLFIGKMGAESLGEQQIILQINYIAALVPLSLAQSLMIMTSRSNKVKIYLIMSFCIAILTTLLLIFIAIFFPQLYINIFIPSTTTIDQEYFKHLSKLLIISSCGFGLYSLNEILSGYFRGLKRPELVMRINILSCTIIIFASYFFGVYLGYGITVIQLIILCVNLASFIYLWLRSGSVANNENNNNSA